MQVFKSALLVAITWFVVVSPLAGAGASSSVIFVCEHGSVKSVIAAEWFNRFAEDRGLSLRAVPRGVEPDETIPEGVAVNLRDDGFDLDGVHPTKIQYNELSKAAHVVVIGTQSGTQSPLFDRLDNPPERWANIPPVSTDYEVSRNAMRKQIENLLDDLERDIAVEER